jgi:hypothetical protein
MPIGAAHLRSDIACAERDRHRYPYANVQLIATGGTVLASAELIGKKRTPTA